MMPKLNNMETGRRPASPAMKSSEPSGVKAVESGNAPVATIAALHRRDALLSALHASGFLSLAEYRNEHARALSLSASHRPVN